MNEARRRPPSRGECRFGLRQRVRQYDRARRGFAINLLWPTAHGLQFGQWQTRIGPAVGAVRVPGNVDIAVRQSALGGIPRHPAGRLAIKHQKLFPVSAGDSLKSIFQVILDSPCECSIARVRQPPTSGYVGPWCLAPDRAHRQIQGLRRMWQHINERGAPGPPDVFRLLGREHVRT